MLNNPKTSYIHRGETIDYKNNGTAEIKSNDVVGLATRIGVAGCDIPVGSAGSVHVIGVFDLPAVTTEAFTVGQAVYWDGTALSSNATGTVPAGWIIEAKAAAGAVARLKIG
ncbi:hypothetical protein BTO30_14910 [Domibacillus antri]|uniref:DUF2190 domain-containing protein n=1 Tax=Domibacillus antri TaxID=1714264 RepID=A0A1Q8Q277_9BACI|nr:DUF2190 family protein [Domibacillus antri]OLN21408.1 hypothetical protein BTO30_14910 [Domibacillus antri]